MIQCDFHTHTNFSGDSQAIPEHMIHSAIAKGLKQICFTDHNDPDFPYDKKEDFGMFDLDTERYLQTMTSYKEQYQNKISVLCGVEIGIQPHIHQKLENYIHSYPFDFVIGSSHLCEKIDPYYPQFWEGRSVKEALLSYFNEIHQNVISYTGYDVYGHLDYIIRYAPTKNNDFVFSDYSDLIGDILKNIVNRGKGIEINSAGYRAGLNAPNPCEEILKLYRSLGGEIITVGSDAHKPEDIARDFTSVEELLFKCGFKYYTVFKERKPEFLPLGIA